MTGVNRLLKSCATPPVNWPRVSSFWGFVELGQGEFMVPSALFHARFQRLVRRPQPFLARKELLKASSGIVLPGTCAKRCASDADQSGGMKGALQEGHVAERVEEPARVRIAFEPTALAREQDEGKIRPFWLVENP